MDLKNDQFSSCFFETKPSHLCVRWLLAALDPALVGLASKAITLSYMAKLSWVKSCVVYLFYAWVWISWTNGRWNISTKIRNTQI